MSRNNDRQKVQQIIIIVSTKFSAFYIVFEMNKCIGKLETFNIGDFYV